MKFKQSIPGANRPATEPGSPFPQWLHARAVPYCLYLLIAALFWLPYSRQVNADGISYLSIAAEYAGGHWRTAVNTYWSPLFSWLLALGMAAGVPGALFARLLLIMSGLLGLRALRRLLTVLNLQGNVAAMTMITAVPMFCYFAFHDVTPDVLVVALLLAYLGITCAPEASAPQWLCAGILGGLLYFAKAYCFPFVIAHLLVTTVIRVFAAAEAAARKRQVAGGVLAIATVILVSAPWLVLISMKAGRLTLSTAGAYNFKLALIGKSGHPMLSQGLFAPPNPYAVSIWEEPDTMPLHTPAASLSARVSAVIRNLADFTRYELWTSVFFPLIVALFAYSVVKRWRAGTKEAAAACLLAMYVLYPAAYFLTFVEHRYIWIEDVLTLVMAAYLFDCFRREQPGRPRRVAWLAFVTALSFCWAPLFVLFKHRTDLRSVSDLVPVLRLLHLHGNVASNGRWDDSQYLAYELRLRYYGMPSDDTGQLTRENVRYVFAWRNQERHRPHPDGRELFRSGVLDVYAIATK
ncbi:MAG: hypothetical protein JO270_00670 [Acidobacteriaceae bacterium]|nr:hypothetical protein [Acidobacteriaceae bacterium]